MDKTTINIQTMNSQIHFQYTKPLWFQELANISNKNIKNSLKDIKSKEWLSTKAISSVCLN
jgi:hypothetical protein